MSYRVPPPPPPTPVDGSPDPTTYLRSCHQRNADRPTPSVSIAASPVARVSLADAPRRPHPHPHEDADSRTTEEDVRDDVTSRQNGGGCACDCEIPAVATVVRRPIFPKDFEGDDVPSRGKRPSVERMGSVKADVQDVKADAQDDALDECAIDDSDDDDDDDDDSEWSYSSTDSGYDFRRVDSTLTQPSRESLLTQALRRQDCSAAGIADGQSPSRASERNSRFSGPTVVGSPVDGDGDLPTMEAQDVDNLGSGGINIPKTFPKSQTRRSIRENMFGAEITPEMRKSMLKDREGGPKYPRRKSDPETSKHWANCHIRYHESGW